MTLIRWQDPVDMIPAFFNSYFGSDVNQSSVPSVNIKENKDNFVLEVAAPGMSKEDFNIELNNNLLTISGNKEENKEEKNEQEKWTRREFYYNSFERSFQLPEEVKAENVSAEYKDGVLEIKVPKQEQKTKEAKKIDVK